ncbi:MAG: UbiA prenyltransferase family protein, partial [Spirochaetia bacterium]|nr:UbiA prenyltransferase family protein [Spirochaetia bacterium]
FLFFFFLFAIRHDPFGSTTFAVGFKLTLAVLAFSFLASSVYIINDWRDRELDKLDPRKKNRPLASGAVSSGLALLVWGLLLGSGLAMGAVLPAGVLPTLLAYLAANFFYSWVGKRIVLVDVFIIAIGYVFRVMVGAYAIQVEASPWLLSCTFFISLFLGFFKRYYEVKVGPAESLIGGTYSVDTLRSFIAITATLAIVTYSLYTLQGTHSYANLFWTIPLVVLGIFRYYMLLQAPEDLEDGNPSDLLLADKFLIVTVFAWMALCAGLILFFQG